jgi:hypothetical protein
VFFVVENSLHMKQCLVTDYVHDDTFSEMEAENNLPPHIKQLSDNPRTFELKLKKILHLHSFYSEEYFQHNLNFV